MFLSNLEYLKELSKITDLPDCLTTAAEREVIKNLFSESGADTKSRTVRSLSEKFIGFYLFRPPKGLSRIRRAWWFSYRNYAGCQIMTLFGIKQIGIPLAESGLKKALKFEFTEIALNLATLLHQHYAAVTGNHKDRDRCAAIVEEKLRLQKAEWEIQKIYALLSDFHNKSDAKEPKSSMRLIPKIDRILKTNKSFRCTFLGTHTKMTILRSNDMHDKVISAARQGIKDFSQNTPSVVLFSFRYKQLISELALNRFGEALATAQNCLELSDKYSYNYAAVSLTKIPVLYKMNRRGEAAITLKELLSRQNKFPATISERCGIAHGYMHFMQKQSNETLDIPRFRLAKFLNQPLKAEKDKRGNNSHIIVLKALLLLQDRKKADLIDRIEGWEKYYYRYLKDSQERVAEFLWSILQTCKKGRFKKAYYLHNFPDKNKKGRSELLHSIAPFDLLEKEFISLLD